ncbi:MAG: YneF family protein [Acholeplasmatales bacterium]|nr:YneF family protein [Acholeplasmatales bacterium]
MEWWQVIITVVITIIVTAIATFFITRKIFANQLKKNPPVNEAMIRAMMTQMGRTPSEKQVRAVMRSMNEAKDK